MSDNENITTRMVNTKNESNDNSDQNINGVKCPLETITNERTSYSENNQNVEEFKLSDKQSLIARDKRSKSNVNDFLFSNIEKNINKNNNTNISASVNSNEEKGIFLYI